MLKNLKFKKFVFDAFRADGVNATYSGIRCCCIHHTTIVVSSDRVYNLGQYSGKFLKRVFYMFWDSILMRYYTSPVLLLFNHLFRILVYTYFVNYFSLESYALFNHRVKSNLLHWRRTQFIIYNFHIFSSVVVLRNCVYSCVVLYIYILDWTCYSTMKFYCSLVGVIK